MQSTTLSRLAVIAWCVATLLAACDRSTEETDAPNPPPPTQRPSVEELSPRCPDEATIAELHNAVFWFENSDATKARGHLTNAAAALEGPRVEETAAELLRELSDIDERFESAHPDSIIMKTEELRLMLTDWHCLTDALHDQTHEGLGIFPERDPIELRVR